MRQPLGVKIIGIVLILIAAMDLLSGVLWLVDPRGTEQRLQEVYQIDPGLHRQELVVSTVIAMAALILGVGLLRLRPWSRWFAIVALILGALWEVPRTLMSGTLVVSKLLWLPISLSFFILLLWYFLRPSVKAQFRKTTAQ